MAIATPLLSPGRLPDLTPAARGPPGFFDAGSPFSCSTLLFTASIGSGVLALPSAAKDVGLYLGIFILMVAGLITAISDAILGQAVSISGQKTYGGILAWSLANSKGNLDRGNYRLPAFDAFMTVYQGAAIVTYLIFLGDFIPSVLQAWLQISLSRTLALVSIVYIVVLPLSVGSEISSLRAVGSFSIWVMLSTAVLALCKIPWSELDTDRPNNMTPLGFNWRQVMHALSMGTFAYMNQVNAVCITSELHKPTRQRLTAVCGWAALGLFLCYATLLSAVYLTFGQATTSNFLQSYPLDDVAVNACRVAVSLTLIFACPLNLFPITSSFFHAIDRCHLAKHAGVRILFNTVVLTICLITAIWVPDVGSFIGYVSAYMATPLMITIPAFVYIACCRAEDDMLARKGVVVERNLCRRSSRMVIPAIALSLTVLLWTAATVNIFASQKA